MDCPNLKELFADRYRVVVEESYYAEKLEFRSAEAVWLMIIPCRNGHICPWEPNLLAACTNSRGAVMKRLIGIGCEIVQDGDDGVNATFPVEAFAEVAEIMKPRKRRRLSPEHRQKLAEASKPYRFTGSQARENDRTHEISTPGGSRVVAG
jgi:hypothetical protein